MGSLKTLAILLTATALVASPALAQEVGTATAVNPQSQSTEPNGQTLTLQVGARIVHQERIRTTPTGSVQLLFLDKSTLSVAPNSDLLIDEYVYNPNENNGRMTASLLKGALRFVGGQLSHQGLATISTPSSTVGIRGGIANVKHDDTAGTRVVALFGIATVANNCGSVKVPAGFVSAIPNVNTCPGEPQRVTAAEVAQFLALLTSQPGQNGGVPGLQNTLPDDIGGGYIGPDGPLLPPNDGGQTITQATQNATGRGLPPPPPPPPPPRYPRPR